MLDLLMLSVSNFQARSAIFPVFFPVIPKIAFGDGFESDCVVSQAIRSAAPKIV